MLPGNPQLDHNKGLADGHAVAGQLPADAGSAAQQATIDVGCQCHKKVRVRMRHIFSLETLRIIFCNKASVEITRKKLRMRQQGRLKRNIAGDTANHKTVERLAHLGNRVQPVLAVHDELGNHRVVEHRDLAAVLHAGVDAHAIQLRGVRRKHAFLWRLKAHQATGARKKITERVFGIDSAFNRPAIALHVLLRERQGLASGYANHQLHQVQAGDALGHRMLDLQARVHLQEVKALVLADHKFNRAGALVIHGLGKQHRLLAHSAPRCF